VSVIDASGAIVPGGNLDLRNLETNDTRKANTQANGPDSGLAIWQIPADSK